jgi:protein-S-isoprenylcysteine O-methyltransferase Ste14
MILLRLAALGFWAFSCVSSLLALVYLAGFVQNRYAFNSIDSGVQIPTREALVANLWLLAMFGAQHSGMARRWFKRRVPWPVERSFFLFATAFVLTVLFFRWEPMPNPVWFVRVNWPFQLIAALGAVMIVWATLTQGVRHFFGFDQVWAYVRGRAYVAPPFRATGLYRYTRHPMMIGTLLYIWATPDMTQGHLLFAVVMTGYVLMGTWFEERDSAYLRLPKQ